MSIRFWRGLAWGLPISLALWAGIIAGARLMLAQTGVST